MNRAKPITVMLTVVLAIFLALGCGPVQRAQEAGAKPQHPHEARPQWFSGP